jgi:hypothetical protein
VVRGEYFAGALEAKLKTFVPRWVEWGLAAAPPAVWICSDIQTRPKLILITTSPLWITQTAADCRALFA